MKLIIDSVLKVNCVTFAFAVSKTSLQLFISLFTHFFF